ncbi:hypothetical protein EIP86_007475 [Pleurotus ostreatoroseus]|nr:hypothetical protein EIP86_007475 [Pleurotus ostreatoroseus]
MDPCDAFSLIFTNDTRIGGQVAEGTIILNVPLLKITGIKEVHLNLRGLVTTKIGSHEEVIYPLHDTLGIWRHATDFAADDHVVHEPFSFTLPLSSVATAEYGQEGRKCDWPARVYFYVEAVGVHADTSKSDIRTDRMFKYLNSDSDGAQISSELVQGPYTGGWKTAVAMKGLKKRLQWNAKRHVVVTLSLPELEALPIWTPIPFKLNISALAKGKKNKPATSASRLFGIDFTIVRDVHIRAHSKEMTIEREFVMRVGSFGALAPKDKDARNSDRMAAIPGPWLPVYDDEKHSTGEWTQEYIMADAFTLTCPPTVRYQNLEVKVRGHNTAANILLI